MDNNSWNSWFSKYVNPLFNKNAEEYFEFLKIKQAPFYPNNRMAKEFYEKIKDDNRFDNELKKFFSFLYSCGFFIKNNISFEEWLKMGDWFNPSSNFYEKTIESILENPEGIEKLKQRLRWLPFLERQEGW